MYHPKPADTGVRVIRFDGVEWPFRDIAAAARALGADFIRKQVGSEFSDPGGFRQFIVRNRWGGCDHASLFAGPCGRSRRITRTDRPSPARLSRFS